LVASVPLLLLLLT